ncbi:MAG: hypothetical protein GYB50_25915 [Rhodobacteraceae bacterium]|nr:hypothetical protein [Paracoccaceae bacterium]
MFAATAAHAIFASRALACNDAYTGDATADLSGQPLIRAYPVANDCPAGRQPVILGGVISCGVPTAGPYSTLSAAAPRAGGGSDQDHLPRVYATEGEKGVVWR